MKSWFNAKATAEYRHQMITATPGEIRTWNKRVVSEKLAKGGVSERRRSQLLRGL